MRKSCTVRLWPMLALCLLVPACFGPPLFILPETLPNAVEDSAYSQALSTDEGRLSWAITDGELPGGLALGESTGIISGTSTEFGDFNFTVAVDDLRLPRRSGEQSYSLTVLEKLDIQFTLDHARVDEAYDDTNAAGRISGGVPPYGVTIVGLPAGMDYNASTGQVTGTPLFESTGDLLEISVSDSGTPQQTDTARATLVIHPVSASITTTALADAAVNEAYSVTLAVENGLQPFTWTVADGVLPDGLRLDRDSGEISGTPTPQAVTRTFTISVTDSDSPASSDSAEFKLVVPVAIVTTALSAATPGTVYEDALGAAAGTAPYTWAVIDGSLPEGLALDEQTGVISGTSAATAATETFTVRVTDGDDPATTDEQELTLEVE